MKCLLSAAVAVVLLASPVMGRQWTARNGGFSGEAELIDVRDGNAILKKQDGVEVTVPLKQLSLGDVRYISDTLKAAEAGITGGKSEAPSADKASGNSTPQPASIAAIDFKKLRYQWKKGQSYVYRVKIKGDRGYYTEYYAGDVTYTVKSANENEVALSMSANMTCGDRLEPIDVFVFVAPMGIMPGRPLRIRSSSQMSKQVVVNVDSQGRVDNIEGDAQLPFLLGDLSQLMIEPLPEANKTTWTVANDTGVSVIGAFYPYYRFWGVRYHEGVPATEKTVYTIQDQTDKQITIAKHYELTTGDENVKGRPRFEATGDGKLVFNTERGLPSKMDYRMRVTVRDGNRTEESPVRITYRLLSDEEIATAKKDAEEAKKKEEQAKKERLRPLTDQEIETVLADLTSDDAERIGSSLKSLGEKRPKTPNPKIAKALEPLMLNGDNPSVRGQAADAIKNWSTPESVPVLLKALKDDWPPVQTGAIETLCKYAPKEAIKPVAQLLTNPHTRHAAVKFLKRMGPDSEDAMLAVFAGSTDDWVRADICKLLGEVGTKKSLAPLEKAVKDENWMVNGNARKALRQVKDRVELDGAK